MTGNTTEYIAVDLDRRDVSRQEHADKVDGVLYRENNLYAHASLCYPVTRVIVV